MVAGSHSVNENRLLTHRGIAGMPRAGPDAGPDRRVGALCGPLTRPKPVRVGKPARSQGERSAARGPRVACRCRAYPAHMTHAPRPAPRGAPVTRRVVNGT